MDMIKAARPTKREIKAFMYIVFLTLFLESRLMETPSTDTFEATESKRMVLTRVLIPLMNKTMEKRKAAIFTTAFGLRIMNTPKTTTIIPETK